MTHPDTQPCTCDDEATLVTVDMGPEDAHVVLFHGALTTAALDLATAQAHALAERTAPAAAELYENRWAEHGPGEWRLMTRRRARGGRWSWTQRTIRAVPLLQGEETGEQGPKGLTAAPSADRAAILREAADEIAGIDFHPNARARSLDIATDLVRRLRRMADEAQQAAPAETEEPK